MKQILLLNILCMYAMSVNEITKLAVSVLAFQQIYYFVHWYWCYQLICIKGYYI